LGKENLFPDLSAKLKINMLSRTFLLTSVALLCCLAFFGQSGFPYEKDWRQIDSLINQKDLPKSAIAEVYKVYNAAKQEKQEAQWVKAIIYKNYLQESDDNGDINKTISDLEREINIAPPRVVSLLKSIEAEQLYQYYLSRSYQIGNRTKIKGDSSTDILTWTAERFRNNIRSLYLASLESQTLLQKTRLEEFNAVLSRGNARDLRPTLYDLLAWRALDYFRVDYEIQHSPFDDLLKKDPLLFTEAPFFMHAAFPNGDSLSNFFNALKIYQGLLRFHAKDIPPDAWIDADISRIQFFHQNAQMQDKDSLYMNALSRITRQFGTFSIATQAFYLQAQWWADKATGYLPPDDTLHRYDYINSISLCRQAISHTDSSEGKSNCERLLKQINRKYFEVNAEGANIPDQPFRALIIYRNIGQVFGRIIRIDDASSNILSENDKKYWDRLKDMPTVRKFKQAIPETTDYQQHLVEIKMDGLPAGRYILLAGTDSAFDDQSVMCATSFFCSSIAYVKNGNNFFVVDRNSGHPLKGVQVKSYIWQYPKDKLVFKQSDVTDINGHFKLALKDDENSALRLEFSLGKDYFSTEDGRNYYRTYNEEDEDDEKGDSRKEFEENHLKNYLFTDRSIYRPGQLVYFKGLLITKDFKTKKYKPVAEKQTVIFLKDANNQDIDSLVLKSNEFGSISGTFRLPQNLLNGEFNIYDGEKRGEKDFSVEEYKRPAFFVEFDSLRNSYSIGDTIQVSGSAQAYAGNKISEAKLSWRVIREAYFPYPWFFKRYPSRSSVEIARGETQTDGNGKFAIHFPALADPSTNKSSRPVYTYRVEAEVTDLNGETRTATTAVSVSYNSFEILSSLPFQNRLSPDSLSRIPVTTKNSEGVFIREKLSVSIRPLESPSRLIRKRYWQQPDQFVISENDYIKWFPNDEYRDETNLNTWKAGPVIVEKTDYTNPEGLFYLDRNQTSHIKPGWYVLDFSAEDRNGELIADKRYIELSGNPIQSVARVYNIIPMEDITEEPGSHIQIMTGSNAENLFVIRAKQKQLDSLTEYSFYNLSQEIKKSDIEIKESDRGGFAINDVFVKNNRWYTSEHIIRVPWTNKDLQVSYMSWHDKVLPGSKEQWEVKITGYKKEQVAAEVLTSVYDASLDQFRPQSWTVPGLYPVYNRPNEWNLGLGGLNFAKAGSYLRQIREISLPKPYIHQYDQLLSFEKFSVVGNMYVGRASGVRVSSAPMNDIVVAGYSTSKKEDFDKQPDPPIKKDNEESISEDNNVQIRKNFNETAFFLPDLRTDAQGNVELNFTMPDALTRWKWMLLANTKDLAFGYVEKTFVTQKELMVQTNMPRFFREGDTMMLPVKIANLSTREMNGTVQFEWMYAQNNQNADQAISNLKSTQSFKVNASQNEIVFFPAIIPAHSTQPLLYRIIARTNVNGMDYSDGEENIIPVLSNRMLVTESLSINMESVGEKHFTFEKLLKSNASGSLRNQSLTIEFTTNPAWYAVQSLPYLMEFPYECAEQTFNRFYANALASHIVQVSPLMEAVFQKWRNTDTAELLTNLQKNQELKSVLLRETPWVLQAESESQQKKNIALLFDMLKMRAALKSALDKLQQAQSETGGFAWFKGGREDRYITQYIISGIGRLRKLNAIPSDMKPSLDKMSRSAIAWLDRTIRTDYDKREKSTASIELKPIQLQYLYMRSLFPEIDIPGNIISAINYYRKLSIDKWMKQTVYMKGMIALFLNRTGDPGTAKDILASLKENATNSAELGTYWKSVSSGIYWQEAPVETQSLLIEVFQELKADPKSIDRMKYWLLQQKRTSHWPTTKATADACYALLLNGDNWLESNQTVSLKLGNYIINSSEEKTAAGSGYFKKIIPGDTVQPDMGSILVNLYRSSDSSGNRQPLTVNRQPSDVSPSWGAIYWQYFENIDKISSANTGLSVTKQLFIEKNTDKGPAMDAVTEKNILIPGDKLKIRIIIKSDRDLEYVHLKDMRAACLEPVNVLSGYQWQDGLGYYQTTQDASTSFFFDRLPKGTHVFEYPLYVTIAGKYSNGISTLQCMYAPEFAAHSEGIRLQVDSK
jgi:hypothetical protein